MGSFRESLSLKIISVAISILLLSNTTLYSYAISKDSLRALVGVDTYKRIDEVYELQNDNIIDERVNLKDVQEKYDIFLSDNFSFSVNSYAIDALSGIKGFEIKLHTPLKEISLPASYPEETRAKIDMLISNLKRLSEFREIHNELLFLISARTSWDLSKAENFMRSLNTLVECFAGFPNISGETKEGAIGMLQRFEVVYKDAKREGDYAIDNFFDKIGFWDKRGKRDLKNVDTLNKFINWMHTEIEDKIMQIGEDSEFNIIDIEHYLTGKPSLCSSVCSEIPHSYGAKILLNGREIWLRKQLGQHRMQIYANLTPTGFGGTTEIIYLEGSSKRGNELRMELVARMLEKLGFSVVRPSLPLKEDSILRAIFGKNEGDISSAELTTKVEISLKFLTKIVDIDYIIMDLCKGYPHNTEQTISKIIDGFVDKVIMTDGNIKNMASKKVVHIFIPRTASIDEDTEPSLSQIVKSIDKDGKYIFWDQSGEYEDSDINAFRLYAPRIYTGLSNKLEVLGLPKLPPYDERTFGQMFIDKYFNNPIEKAIQKDALLITEAGLVKNGDYKEKVPHHFVIDCWKDKRLQKNMIETACLIDRIPFVYENIGTVGSLELRKSELAVLDGTFTLYVLYYPLPLNKSRRILASIVLKGNEIVDVKTLKDVLSNNAIPYNRQRSEITSDEMDEAIEEVDVYLQSDYKSIFIGKHIQVFGLLPGITTGELTFIEDAKGLDGKVLFLHSLTDSNIQLLDKCYGLITMRGNINDHLNICAKDYGKPRVLLTGEGISEGQDEEGRYISIVSRSSVKDIFLYQGYAIGIYNFQDEVAEIRMREGDLLTVDGFTGMVHYIGKRDIFRDGLSILRSIEKEQKLGNLRWYIKKLFSFIEKRIQEKNLEVVKFIMQKIFLYGALSSPLYERPVISKMVEIEDVDLERYITKWLGSGRYRVKKMISPAYKEFSNKVQDYMFDILHYAKYHFLSGIEVAKMRIKNCSRIDQLYYELLNIYIEKGKFQLIQRFLGVRLSSSDKIVDLEKITIGVRDLCKEKLRALRMQLVEFVKKDLSLDKIEELKQKPYALLLMRRILERIEMYEMLNMSFDDTEVSEQVNSIKTAIRELEKKRQMEIERAKERLLLDIEELDIDFAGVVGNKAAGLGWLKRFLKWYEEEKGVRFFTAEGFCLTSKAYSLFLEQRLPPDKKDIIQIINTVIGNKIEEMQIGDIIRLVLASDLKDSLKVSIIERIMEPLGMHSEVQLRLKEGTTGGAVRAVRSSVLTLEDTPLYSGAGIFNSVLGVRGSNQEISNALKEKVWPSLYSMRALSYYRKIKANEGSYWPLLQGGIVQNMIDTEISGVITTVDIASRNRGIVTINAGWGLGSSIVDTIQDADRYNVDKNTKQTTFLKGEKIRKVVLGEEGIVEVDTTDIERNSFCLSQDTIDKLVDLVVEMEYWFGFVVDIEFAMKGKNIYILQVRPVPGFKVTDGERTKVNEWLFGYNFTEEEKLNTISGYNNAVEMAL